MIQTAKDLFAPLSISEFMDKYWRKRPVQIRGDASKVEGLFDHRAFFTYCANPEVDLYAGKVFDEARFQQTSILPRQAERLFAHGFTVQIEDLHLADAGLMKLANQVRDALGIYSAMESAAFLAPPGVGFGQHIDQNPDIFSIQIAGTKKWTFSSRPVIEYPLVQTITPKTGKPVGDPWHDLDRPDVPSFESVVQNPGDVFYFPGGVWHSTETLGSEPSCHVVLASTNETYADFFFEVLRPRLLPRAEWRNVGDKLPAYSSQMREQLARRLSELKSIVADVDVEALVEAFEEGRRTRSRGAYRQHYVAQQALERKQR